MKEALELVVREEYVFSSELRLRWRELSRMGLVV